MDSKKDLGSTKPLGAREAADPLGPFGKLANIGILINGFAHDLNNALTGILGNLELYKLKLPAEAQDNRHLQRLDHFVQRIHSLAREMLMCGRKGKPCLQPTNVNGIINNLVPRLKPTLAPDIQVKVNLAGDLPAAQADPAQVAFALAALWQNAAEAVDAKGLIEIATYVEEVGEEGAAVIPNPGKYIAIALSDNGRGMDENIQAHLFEPLFSTKPDGDGMSMAAVQAIVHNHFGWLSTESAPDRGTTIRIFLPASS